MKKLTKADITQEAFELCEDYAHGKIDRRRFIEKRPLFAVGTLTIPSLLSFLTSNYLDSAFIKPKDDTLKSHCIIYDSPQGGSKIKTLLSLPKHSKKKLFGIIIAPENSDLKPYIKDVGRTAALEGFITRAPDTLSPLGAYPENDGSGHELQKKRTHEDILEDFIAAYHYHYLQSHKQCNDGAGVGGLCFAGSIANMMAVKLPTSAASVSYYGGQPTIDEAKNLKTALLLQHATPDTIVNEGWLGYKIILNNNKVKYTAFIFPAVNHGFHNNTTQRL